MNCNPSSPTAGGPPRLAIAERSKSPSKRRQNAIVEYLCRFPAKAEAHEQNALAKLALTVACSEHTGAPQYIGMHSYTLGSPNVLELISIHLGTQYVDMHSHIMGHPIYGNAFSYSHVPQHMGMRSDAFCGKFLSRVLREDQCLQFARVETLRLERRARSERNDCPMIHVCNMNPRKLPCELPQSPRLHQHPLRPQPTRVQPCHHSITPECRSF